MLLILCLHGFKLPIRAPLCEYQSLICILVIEFKADWLVRILFNDSINLRFYLASEHLNKYLYMMN
jgi:hypothetical protein